GVPATFGSERGDPSSGIELADGVRHVHRGFDMPGRMPTGYHDAIAHRDRPSVPVGRSRAGAIGRASGGWVLLAGPGRDAALLAGSCNLRPTPRAVLAGAG